MDVPGFVAARGNTASNTCLHSEDAGLPEPGDLSWIETELGGHIGPLEQSHPLSRWPQAHHLSLALR